MKKIIITLLLIITLAIVTGSCVTVKINYPDSIKEPIQKEYVSVKDSLRTDSCWY